MGACASRPKNFDSKQEPLIVEEDSNTPKAEGETVPQENGGEAEAKKEEPLVDMAEPAAPEEAKKEEEASAESKPEASAGLEEEPKEKAADETKEEKKEVKQVEDQKPKEAPAEAAAAAPTSEDKSDAPLVTL